jgi:hypothetical protein
MRVHAKQETERRAKGMLQHGYFNRVLMPWQQAKQTNLMGFCTTGHSVSPLTILIKLHEDQD